MVFVSEDDGSIEVTPPYEEEMTLEQMEADQWSMVLKIEGKHQYSC
jgi:hypothetical protein